MEYDINLEDAMKLAVLLNLRIVRGNNKFCNKILRIQLLELRIQLLEECGLKSTHKDGYFYGADDSYLIIVDKKKWFLAKIKYGI